MSCTQVGLPLYMPGWCAQEAETWVRYRHAAVRKGPGLNHLQRLRSVSMRLSASSARQPRIVTNDNRRRKPYQFLVFLRALSASPRLCGEEHFRTEAELR